MSSLFSRSSKSASSSTTSLAKKADEPPKTSEVFTTPPEGVVPTKKWEYNAEQLQKIEELKAYTSTLLLPASDPYHPWEARFLADPGTHPRYMRAAKWRVDEGKKRIEGTIKWRREYKPELIEPGDVSVEAETGKIILSGFDQDARPILYMRPGRENTETSPRQIRHLIYHLERAIDLMPPGQEQVAIIVDYKSATSQSNPSISTARKVLGILQNHYVERLGRGLVVNMPWWINAFFSGISPFMDPITRDKIRFNPKLVELVPPAQLDYEFGGDYNLDFDHATYWPTITDFCRIAPDGTRISPDGKPWVPPLGNGIKAAVDGLVPAPGAVSTGDVVKANGDTAAAVPAAASLQKTQSRAQEYADAHRSPVGEKGEAQGGLAVANGNGNGEEGGGGEGDDAPVGELEKKTQGLTVSSTTAPGKPEGPVVFDHEPDEGEKKVARESIDVVRA